MYHLKSVVCLLVLGVAACAALGTSAFRSSSGGHHNSYGISYGGGGHGGSTDDAHASIAALKSDVRHDGFDYALETTNHIQEQRSGDAYGNIHGNFGWLSKDGVPVQVSYVADENGYQPSSDLLPTPPPIPKEIVKLLEYIRTHPQKEENQYYGGGQAHGQSHGHGHSQYGHRG